jgi:hypothetical protein
MIEKIGKDNFSLPEFINEIKVHLKLEYKSLKSF